MNTIALTQARGEHVIPDDGAGALYARMQKGQRQTRFTQVMSAQGRIVTEISGAERELRPVLENDETGEEREKENYLCDILRKILVVGLLVNILFFVACAYSVVGSFFPIEVII